MIVNLRKIRKNRNLSAQQVADALSITKASYYKYETNERDIPTDLLLPLAKLFDCSVDYLLRDEEPTKEEFMNDFVAYAERHFNDNTIHIISYLTKHWKGNFEALVHMSGAYAALPKEIRKDISALCLHNFEHSKVNPDIEQYINTEMYKEKLKELYND